jgi:hypothetical protein
MSLSPFSQDKWKFIEELEEQWKKMINKYHHQETVFIITPELLPLKNQINVLVGQ